MMAVNNILKRRIVSLPRWDLYSIVVLFIVFVLQALNWRNFPLFLDCYYHLSVMRGFADAGGWVGESFWEYAPFGRPHIYPPLFHIMGLAVFKLGLNVITVARLFDFLIYPSFLYINWRVVRDIFSKELAFFNLILLVSSYPLYLAMVNNIPFVLALMFGILSFYFIQKGRLLSSVLCLSLSFYSHALMSWLSFAAVFIYGLLNARVRKIAFFSCLGSCMLASPLLLHQASNLSFFNPFRALEYFFFYANPTLFLLAFLGLISAFRKDRKYLFFAALTMAMSVLILTNRDRFFSGQGSIPVSFFAAVALEEFWKRFFSGGGRFRRVSFFAFLFVIFYLAAPVIVSAPVLTGRGANNERSFLILDSWILNESAGQGGIHEDKGKTFYNSRMVDDAVRLLVDNSHPDDIVFFNYSYGGGMIASLAGRATSGAMLKEVLPYNSVDPIAQARAIFLFKDPYDRFFAQLPFLAKSYGLRRVGETELALLYYNDGCRLRRKIVQASVPFAVVFGLFLMVLALIYIDGRLMKKKLT